MKILVPVDTSDNAVKAVRYASDIGEKLGDQEFIAEAPVALAFFQDPRRSAIRYGLRGQELYSLQDATPAPMFSYAAEEPYYGGDRGLNADKSYAHVLFGPHVLLAFPLVGVFAIVLTS